MIKNKVCENGHLLLMMSTSQSDFTHSEHFVLMVMVSFYFFKMQGSSPGALPASFILEGLLGNGVIILPRTEEEKVFLLSCLY